MKLMRTTVASIVAATFSLTAVSAFAAASLTGAGATFPAPVYAKWADSYQKETGNKVNYQGIGSSGGVKQIVANTVDFGASDAPLSDDKLAADGLFQFPRIIRFDGTADGHEVIRMQRYLPRGGWQRQRVSGDDLIRGPVITKELREETETVGIVGLERCRGRQNL